MSTPVGEDLTRSRCLALLPTTHVGHVGVSVNALPAILPVNYIVVGDAVLIRTPGESALLHATVGSVVAFEVDQHDGAGHLAWSVLVRGIAIEVTESAEFERGRELLSEKWPSGEPKEHFVTIPATVISGHRFTQVC